MSEFPYFATVVVGEPRTKYERFTIERRNELGERETVWSGTAEDVLRLAAIVFKLPPALQEVLARNLPAVVIADGLVLDTPVHRLKRLLSDWTTYTIPERKRASDATD